MIPIEPSLRFASCPAFDIVASFLACSKPSLGKRKGEKPLSKSRSKLVYLGNLYLECLGERIGYTGGSDVSGKSYRYLSYNAEDIRVSITRKIRFDGLLFKIFIFFSLISHHRPRNRKEKGWKVKVDEFFVRFVAILWNEKQRKERKRCQRRRNFHQDDQVNHAKPSNKPSKEPCLLFPFTQINKTLFCGKEEEEKKKHVKGHLPPRIKGNRDIEREKYDFLKVAERKEVEDSGCEKKNSARDEGETARNQRAEKREEGRRRGRHSLCKDEYRATDRECLYNPIFRSIAVLYAISHLCPGLPSHPTA